MCFFLNSSVRCDVVEEENLAHSMLTSDEQQEYLSNQDGTARLDSFTHCLISKCPGEVRYKTVYFVQMLWKHHVNYLLLSFRHVD